MKYQIRIKDTFNDRPYSGLLDTYEEAAEKLEECKEEIIRTWATPCPDAAYIFKNKLL